MRTRQTRLLRPAPPDAGAVFIQNSTDPVFADMWGDGVDVVCPHCQTSVLAADVSEDQLWDVAFECRRCGGRSTSPSLPLGMALARNTLYAQPGHLPISTTVALRRSVIADARLLTRRAQEVGIRGSTFGEPTAGGYPLSGDYLDTQISELRRVLGEPLDRLIDSDALGQRSQALSR